MNLRNYMIKMRKELEEDVTFFGYSNLIVCSDNKCTSMYTKNDKDSEGSIFEVIDEAFAKNGIEYDIEEIGQVVKVTVYPSKALDGMMSEIDIMIKSEDDAIDTQKSVMKNVTKFFDKLFKEWDNLDVDMEAEFMVSLSDESPFKKLSKSQLRNKNTVDKTYRLIPRFMYFEEELDVFEAEYQEILKEIETFKKKQELRILNTTLEELSNVKFEDEAKEVPEILKGLIEVLDKRKIEYDPKLKNVRNKVELISTLKQMISALK